MGMAQPNLWKNDVPPSEIEAVYDYLSTVSVTLPAPIRCVGEMSPIAEPVPGSVLGKEISLLPDSQLLVCFKGYQVFHANQRQIPQTMREIARLREFTFRSFEEGSGLAIDQDEYDDHYDQLFVWDNDAQTILGGYRLGQTDVLRAAQGSAGVYLSTLFDFEEAFFDDVPTLEIGRSFVSPEYQRNHHSLHLLWRGIGQYLVKYPRYRHVYGVVSMSRIYDPRVSAVLRDVLVEPLPTVAALTAYEADLGAPWRRFLRETSNLTLRNVSTIVKKLERSERDIPVLIRHYHKLGARFVSSAVDPGFNNTPGLLLRLEIPKIPEKYLNQYLAEGKDGYLAYR